MAEGKKYIFLDHTADAKFRASGRSLEEAFDNSARAMVSLMWEAEGIQPRLAIPVRVQGMDIKQLLLNYLEEILYLLEVRFFLLSSIEGTRITPDESGYSLESLFRGDTNGEGYRIYGEVKAVTYDEMEVSQAEDWTVQVVVDL